MLATTYMSAWVVGIIFVVVILMGIFCVFNLYIDIQDAEKRCKRISEDLEAQLRQADEWLVNRMVIVENDISQMKESPDEPKIENKLCPECNEEKDIPSDDYKCVDCRGPNEIAA